MVTLFCGHPLLLLPHLRKIALKSVEYQLLTLGKYPILGVQLIGYFPLSVTQYPVTLPTDKSKSIISSETLKALKFRWLGFPFLSQFIFVLFLILASLTSMEPSYKKANMDRYSNLSSDFVIITAVSMCCTGNAVVNRVYGLLTVRKTLKVWQVHCHLLQQVHRIWNDEGILTKLKESARRHFFRSGLLLLLPGIMIALSDYIFVNLLSISKKNIIGEMVQRRDILLLMGALFWLYFSYANIFLSGWITFYIKLYNLVLCGILRNIKNFEDAKILDEVSSVYDVLIELVSVFNDSLGARLFVEVAVNIAWTLGCTYFSFVCWKIDELGGTCTNMLAAFLAMRTLYIYGNECENLEQSRVELVTKLSQIGAHNFDEVQDKKVQCLTRKVINCKLWINPGNFFVLNRSFVLSILSVLMTILIVMAQFRDSDELNGLSGAEGDFCNCSNFTSLSYLDVLAQLIRTIYATDYSIPMVRRTYPIMVKGIFN
ncbi:hypothetical protein Fcan01_20957 [Folsomia candida]|uniref:Gustatory receptor n=1 Tax=Folsomia candida TaxID=158441 RepID=A0A226DJP5_FOLCA|nr:hypothetical protein Fcan01_20957 [Folsomia candida]